MSVTMGVGVGKASSEQVSSDDHQMSLAWGRVCLGVGYVQFG